MLHYVHSTNPLFVDLIEEKMNQCVGQKTSNQLLSDNTIKVKERYNDITVITFTPKSDSNAPPVNKSVRCPHRSLVLKSQTTVLNLQKENKYSFYGFPNLTAPPVLLPDVPRRHMNIEPLMSYPR